MHETDETRRRFAAGQRLRIGERLIVLSGLKGHDHRLTLGVRVAADLIQAAVIGLRQIIAMLLLVEFGARLKHLLRGVVAGVTGQALRVHLNRQIGLVFGLPRLPQQ